MSVYDATRIEKPSYFRISPLRRGRGPRRAHVIGFDSESENGKPFLFQFSRTGDENAVDLIPINGRNPLDVFMTYVYLHCTRKDTEYLIVGWNLAYEFTQLFATLPSELNTMGEYAVLYRLEDAGGKELARYRVQVFNDKRFSVVIENLATKRRVRFIDGMAFFVTSLDKAGAMLGLGRKVQIESKRFTLADLDNELFLAYARQDAYLTRRIGEYIVALHERFDVATCITAPSFAARVFRRHFLTREIPLPEPALEQAGLNSYHGGKNGYYLNGPKHLTNVYAYDITSAYPEAMRQLPNLEEGTWEYVDHYTGYRHALWCVTARVKRCKWRAFMHHDAKWCEGYIENVWLTSYELDAAIRLNEVDLITAHGWQFVGEPGGPLIKYVDTFFDEKRTSEGAKREAAKLFLNSLYGKFFQKVPLGIVGYYDLSQTLDGEPQFVLTDPTQAFDWQAGGLYHPPIASLITGFVRAKIHELEHRYGAIMTSTDGFFAIRAPNDSDIGKDLGKLTVERGDLSIWRERLYDFKPHGNGKSKYALHGFRGNIDALRKIPLKPGSYEYYAQQVITLKLATKTFHGKRFDAGVFATLPYVLDLRAPP
jgi:hypothetical protein